MKKLNKTQRMQMKLFACLMGVLLILILLIGKIIMLLVHNGEESPQPTPTPHIPVVETLHNVWIMEEMEEGIRIFRDGEEENYLFGALAVTAEGQELMYRPGESLRENVADVVLSDGRVTRVILKKDKITGKVLSADSVGVELEGYGRLPLAEDYRGYRLYDSLEMCGAGELFFGYNYADFCVENGEICGILMVREEAMESIRVLVKTTDFQETLHEEVVVGCDVDFTVYYGDYSNPKQQKYSAGESVCFQGDSRFFETERVKIVPDVLTGKIILKSLKRNQGTPAYRGHMELLKTEDGIAVVNEVSLEEYLYSVVPSEMPSSYPAEALKAQAICARTYAYGRMKRAGYPRYGAHVDDSTTYQVYNNIREQESTTTAVKETYGQLLMTGEGALAGTYYYSTSCGVGSDSNVWKTKEAPTLTYLQSKALNKAAMEGETQSIGELLKDEEAFAAFIKASNEQDFESKINFYRWKYTVDDLDEEHMLETLQKRYKANEKLVLTWDAKKEEYVSREIKKLQDITAIYVEKRGSGGYADELIIETKKNKYKVISEHNIRYVLHDGESKVVLQNGSKTSMSLLPSGFFIIEAVMDDGEVEGYEIIGGGYGHGVGLSQNGAGEMAKCGYTADRILLYFYENCWIQELYKAE